MDEHRIKVQKEDVRGKFRNLKGNDRTQGKGFSRVVAVPVAALLILAAKSAYDYWNYWSGPVKDALADAKAEAYFAERSGTFCTFEGVWHDWERDETITLDM